MPHWHAPLPIREREDTMFQVDPTLRLRRPLPRNKCDHILLAFPIPWAVKKNTGMTEPYPAVFSRQFLFLAANAARGLLSESGTMAQALPPEHMSLERAAQLGIEPFDVRNLFLREGRGRTPGNHPVYQALVGMAIARGPAYRGTYGPQHIKQLCKSLMLEWGDVRIEREIDIVLNREDEHPWLLERDDAWQYRFPIEAFLDIPLVGDPAPGDEREGPRHPGGRPRGTQVEAALEAGPATTIQLIEATGLDRSSVATTLSRLKRQGRIKHIDRGVWGLAVDKSTET